MVILLTGVAGFIASKVADVLLHDGHTVVGVDNLNDAYDVQLKQWRLATLRDRPGFQFFHVDITDRAALTHLVEGGQVSAFDAIINLAARAGVRQSVENPWVYQETNVTGTLNLLELCRTHQIKKFVLSSTSSLYGGANIQPFSEDARTDDPLSPYAASKKAAEVLCYTYHYLHSIDITVLRYFTVYGPAGRPDMSPFRFVQWVSSGRPVVLFGDGQQSRDFTYVDDIARGTVAALKPLGYEIINLGNDTPVVLLDMLRMIEQQLGKTAIIQYQPRHAADVLSTWADISKARRLLNWQPHITLEQGIHHLVTWYQEQESWARTIQT